MKRNFIIGDQWFYVKIYCGVRTSDHILINAIQPLCKQLKESNIIDHWFFMRYNDPDYHLRIRFYLNDTKMLGQLIEDFNTIITPFLETNFIYKIQTDTYQRELERYGANTIEQFEKLFYYQSKAILKHINEREDDTLFFLKVVCYIHALIQSFELTPEQQLDFAVSNATGFKDEFVMNKNNVSQLYKKYQLHNKEFRSLLQKNEVVLQPESIALIRDIKTRNPNTSSLLASHIHMLVNRSFRSKQRFYELVCYDFLSRHYKYVKYRKQQTS